MSANLASVTALPADATIKATKLTPTATKAVEKWSKGKIKVTAATAVFTVDQVIELMAFVETRSADTAGEQRTLEGVRKKLLADKPQITHVWIARKAEAVKAAEAAAKAKDDQKAKPAAKPAAKGKTTKAAAKPKAEPKLSEKLSPEQEAARKLLSAGTEARRAIKSHDGGKGAYVRKDRVRRETGSRVQVLDLNGKLPEGVKAEATENGKPIKPKKVGDREYGYAAACITHGNFVHTDSFASAQDRAKKASVWCPECLEAAKVIAVAKNHDKIK